MIVLTRLYDSELDFLAIITAVVVSMQVCRRALF